LTDGCPLKDAEKLSRASPFLLRGRAVLVFALGLLGQLGTAAKEKLGRSLMSSTTMMIAMLILWRRRIIWMTMMKRK